MNNQLKEAIYYTLMIIIVMVATIALVQIIINFVNLLLIWKTA
jgi:hypothetical protein